MKRLTAIDLFAGAGGLSEGLRQAGFAVAGAIELDALAARTYALNHRLQPVQDDIRRVDATAFARRIGIPIGRLDVLAACPPCQGYSTLRTHNRTHAVSDARNDLVTECLRFVEALCPRVVLIENVPGLLKDARLSLVRSRLADFGYTTDARVVDAADFGVPQRRKRMVLVGVREGVPAFPLLCPERRTVRDAIGSLPPPGRTGDRLHDWPESRSERVAKRIRSIPRNGGSRADLPLDLQLPCHRDSDGFKDVYGRMFWDRVAPTITSGCYNPSKGRFLHPDQDRCITLREAALLQAFPHDYQFCLSRGKAAAAAMIGNALPPELARRHALALLG